MQIDYERMEAWWEWWRGKMEKDGETQKNISSKESASPDELVHA